MKPFRELRKLKVVRKVLGDEKPKPTLERDPDAPEAKSTPGFLERSAQRVAGKIYSTHADDLEDRASRVVSKAYESQADDLEDRAVRALRRALADESDRIKAVIEHSVNVKKREVRLSLLVLIAAAIVYLLLEAFAHGGPAAG